MASGWAVALQAPASVKRLLAKSSVICDALGDSVVSGLAADNFKKISTVRNEDGAFMSPVKPRTVNLEQRNLSSVFSTLKKPGHWSAPNPLAGLPTFKIDESELAFLAPEEIKRLLDACADSHSNSLLTIAKICLATGARWSEAENLQGISYLNSGSLIQRPKAKRTEPYRYLRNFTMNSPRTEGSYSPHVEKLLSGQ